jgi:hypothetical protein
MDLNKRKEVQIQIVKKENQCLDYWKNTMETGWRLI